MSGNARRPGDPDDGGLYCYMATPCDDRGEIDTGALIEYANAIVDAGVTGLTCIASTCEGPYLTEDQRRLTVQTIGKAVAGRARLNVGIGAVSTRQAIENARHAEAAGATSLMLETPQYFPITIEAVRRHCEEIAGSVGLPIRLYNLPWATGLDLTPLQICQLGGVHAISSVKEASHDVTRLRDIEALCGNRFALYCGFHYQALEGFRYGARGWEIMMHPLIAAPCVELYRLLRADAWSAEGERLFRKLEPMFRFFRVNGVPQSIKAISAWTGLKLGGMRAPLQELRPESRARLKEIVQESMAA